MPIRFVPARGAFLICDFDLARIHPEMNKRRRVVVISPRSYNHRHGQGPGRCIVVPFSATRPKFLTPSVVAFSAGSYRSLTKDSWAICDAVMAVSHDRLDKIWIGARQSLDETMSDADLHRLEVALNHATGADIAKGEN